MVSQIVIIDYVYYLTQNLTVVFTERNYQRILYMVDNERGQFVCRPGSVHS